MLSINPYLNFNGKCEEAFDFYKSVFGGEFVMLQRFRDVPPMPGAKPIADNELDRIMHVSLPMGNGILMGSDAPESMGFVVNHGNGQYISINTESEAETQRIFNGLAEGGSVHMPLDKTFWGAYFGMIADKFGVQWMLSYSYEQK
jgi:PhnB protein